MLPPDGVVSEAVWGRLEAAVRETATFDPSRLPKDPPCVSEFTVARVGSRYRAEIPRFCLAATGRKPEAA